MENRIETVTNALNAFLTESRAVGGKLPSEAIKVHLDSLRTLTRGLYDEQSMTALDVVYGCYKRACLVEYAED